MNARAVSLMVLVKRLGNLHGEDFFATRDAIQAGIESLEEDLIEAEKVVHYAEQLKRDRAEMIAYVSRVLKSAEWVVDELRRFGMDYTVEDLAEVLAGRVEVSARPCWVCKGESPGDCIHCDGTGLDKASAALSKESLISGAAIKENSESVKCPFKVGDRVRIKNTQLPSPWAHTVTVTELTPEGFKWKADAPISLGARYGTYKDGECYNPSIYELAPALNGVGNSGWIGVLRHLRAPHSEMGKYLGNNGIAPTRAGLEPFATEQEAQRAAAYAWADVGTGWHIEPSAGAEPEDPTDGLWSAALGLYNWLERSEHPTRIGIPDEVWVPFQEALFK